MSGHIRVRFYEGSGPFAWAIRFRTWGRMTHVDVVLPSGLCIGAVAPGGVKRYAEYAAKTSVSYDVPVPEPELGIAWLKRQVGKSYDYAAIAGFGMRRDWNQQDKWFCSELVTRTLIEAGLPPLLNARAYMVGPRDLLLAISWAGAQEVHT